MHTKTSAKHEEAKRSGCEMGKSSVRERRILKRRGFEASFTFKDRRFREINALAKQLPFAKEGNAYNNQSHGRDAVRPVHVRLAVYADVASWCFTFGRINEGNVAESHVTCFAPDASLEIPNGTAAAARAAQSGDNAGRKAIRLHEMPTVMGGGPMSFNKCNGGGVMEVVPLTLPFQFQLFQRPWESRGSLQNISAESLAQQGAGEARLKDINMKVFIRLFPMRVLALHYLRLCAKEGQWDGVTHMAKSIHREVAVQMLTSLSGVCHHRLPLVLFWASAIGSPPHVFGLTTEVIRQNPAEAAAVLPILLTLPPAVQKTFEKALKEAINPQDEETFAKLHKALVKESADRQCLEAENERLRQENAMLNEQLCRGTKRSRDEMEGR